MKPLRLLPFLLTLIVLQAVARADEAKFFPEKGTHFGVYYYPEHWPENHWERDIQRVA
ncbi:MAG: hypothetical protein HKP20_03330, partial [Akkermansiaceae bacterium]|nr:hypothetical protein [Akkermansiaceae bacterium]